MSMGRRKDEWQECWIATTDLPTSPGNVFYEQLNRLLADHGLDTFVEDLCRPYYAENTGRDSMPPGVYFRMLMIGYFEGLDSQRGIAWRCVRTAGRFRCSSVTVLRRRRRIVKMKDGRTPLAHKVEHVVDLDTDLLRCGSPRRQGRRRLCPPRPTQRVDPAGRCPRKTRWRCRCG